jgi:hypothetical protein
MTTFLTDLGVEIDAVNANMPRDTIYHIEFHARHHSNISLRLHNRRAGDASRDASPSFYRNNSL